jgi:hypothetical protein
MVRCPLARQALGLARTTATQTSPGDLSRLGTEPLPGSNRP